MSGNALCAGPTLQSIVKRLDQLEDSLRKSNARAERTEKRAKQAERKALLAEEKSNVSREINSVVEKQNQDKDKVSLKVKSDSGEFKFGGYARSGIITGKGGSAMQMGHYLTTVGGTGGVAGGDFNFGIQMET